MDKIGTPNPFKHLQVAWHHPNYFFRLLLENQVLCLLNADMFNQFHLTFLHIYRFYSYLFNIKWSRCSELFSFLQALSESPLPGWLPMKSWFFFGFLNPKKNHGPMKLYPPICVGVVFHPPKIQQRTKCSKGKKHVPKLHVGVKHLCFSEKPFWDYSVGGTNT